mgnify:FL=1|jgi:hypothetical protein
MRCELLCQLIENKNFGSLKLGNGVINFTESIIIKITEKLLSWTHCCFTLIPIRYRKTTKLLQKKEKLLGNSSISKKWLA